MPLNRRPDAAGGFVLAVAAIYWAERLEDPHVVLRVAMLDDDHGVRPVAHIFIANAAPWLDEGDDRRAI